MNNNTTVARGSIFLNLVQKQKWGKNMGAKERHKNTILGFEPITMTSKRHSVTT